MVPTLPLLPSLRRAEPRRAVRHWHRLAAVGLVAGFLAPATPSPAAEADLRTDGIWSGAASTENTAVTARASIVSGMGELALELKLPTRAGSVRCRYLLRLDGVSVTDTYRRANLSSPLCPNEPGLSLEESEDGGLVLTFDPDALPEMGETVLRRALGPLAESERAAIPPMADILGARLGMTRADVEAVLVDDLGYAPQAERLRALSMPGYVAETVHYARRPEHDGATLADDIVAVAYGGAADAEGAASPEARAVVLRRKWVTHPGDNVSAAALRAAVNEKYGAGEVTRFYGQDGTMVDSAAQDGGVLIRPRPYCRQPMSASGRERQVYSYRLSIPGEPQQVETNVFALCGTFIKAQVVDRVRPETGTSHPVLDLVLASYQLMNDEVWKRYATRLSAELEEKLTTEGAEPVTVAPRL